jgi:Flp pilus assembly protein TadG
MKRISKRGSHAIEFALIFPIFITLIFGGFDYSWYILQRYVAADVVSSGCRAGAITGIDLLANPSAAAEAAIAEKSINSLLSCSRLPCYVTITEVEGYSPSTKQLQCTLEAPTILLSGIVPMLPDTVVANSTWPVEPFTNEELLEELGY